MKFSKRELEYAISIASVSLSSSIASYDEKVKKILGEGFIDVLEQFDVRYIEEAFERRENLLKSKIGKNYKDVVRLAFNIRMANKVYFGNTFYSLSEKFRQFSMILGNVDANTKLDEYKILDFEESTIPLALAFVGFGYDDVISCASLIDKDTLFTFLVKATNISHRMVTASSERELPVNADIVPTGMWTKKLSDKAIRETGIPEKMARFINTLARPKGVLETDIPKELWGCGSEKWDELISYEIAASTSVDKVSAEDFGQVVFDKRISKEMEENFENFDRALFDKHSNKVECISEFLNICSRRNLKPGKIMEGVEVNSNEVFDVLFPKDQPQPVQLLTTFFQAFPDDERTTTKEYRGIYLESAENVKPHILDFEYIERLYKNSASVEELIRLVGFEEFVRLGAAKNIYATRMALSQGVYDQEILFENKEAFLKLADYDNSPYRKKALLERVRKAVEEVEKRTLDAYDLYAKNITDSFFDSQLPALPKELLHKYFKRVSEYDRDHFIEYLKHILNNLKEYNEDELKKLVVAKLFEGGKNE